MKHIKNNFITTLSNLYETSEINEIFYECVSHITGKSRSQIIMSLSDKASDEIVKQCDTMLSRLQTGEPMQYVLGFEWFDGMKFAVDSRVLIPRPETVALVDEIEKLKIKNAKCEMSVLDIGTGSGAIAVAVKKRIPEAEVTAADISEDALEVASTNAKKNETDIIFVCDDALSDSFLSGCEPFDVIVSNPPYICPNEMAEMRTNVLDFEPHLALFVPQDDPLLFYNKIAKFAINNLEKDGALLFETNAAYVHDVEKMMCNTGFNDVVVIKDCFDRERFVIGKKI
ncbi:MAG: peptide chain release factor N(5)-glutamine methyltransferase [Paludibacteraceae bacterium]|jgi:release factor glutamine methyltransferase|nr:peptide chain release factor N(5)-glutamine methyltransferase [Paludibacteraceae bacterium]